jgi:TPP-dependent indolepyruvate ferredoxin oxidoreductase alpha subunit
MGLVDNINNLGGGLFVDAAKGLGKLGAMGAKAVAKGVKSSMDKAKEAKEDREAEAEDEDDAEFDAGPAFCPHCGKRLR